MLSVDQKIEIQNINFYFSGGAKFTEWTPENQ